MKSNQLYLLLLILLIAFATVWFFGRLQAAKRAESHRFLEGAVQTGITLQLTIGELYKLIGRYPKYAEFSNVIPLICSTAGVVTPGGEISPSFNNTGGWSYDERSGQIAINSNTKYFVDAKSWVDLSKINFRSPTKVEIIQDGESKLLDYSYLNEHAMGSMPQIDGIIKNWAVTNKPAGN